MAKVRDPTRQYENEDSVKFFKQLVKINGGSAAVAADLWVNENHLRELYNWSHLRPARSHELARTHGDANRH